MRVPTVVAEGLQPARCVPCLLMPTKALPAQAFQFKFVEFDLVRQQAHFEELRACYIAGDLAGLREWVQLCLA